MGISNVSSLPHMVLFRRIEEERRRIEQQQMEALQQLQEQQKKARAWGGGEESPSKADAIMNLNDIQNAQQESERRVSKLTQSRKAHASILTTEILDFKTSKTEILG